MSYLVSHRRGLLILLLVSASLTLGGCRSDALPSSFSAALESIRSNAAAAETAPVAATETAPAAVTQTASVTATQSVTGAAASDSAAPVRLSIPALALEAEVTPMGWEPAMNGDVVTTRWVVPLDTLGWAVNSAEAGAAGNVVIIGHQAQGAALLRPLVLGDVAVGQEIRLSAADGATYLYTVSEVSPLLAAIGATPAETAQAAAYLAPTDTARLTLVSGWPADTTTHRLFVVAEYAGTAP